MTEWSRRGMSKVDVAWQAVFAVRWRGRRMRSSSGSRIFLQPSLSQGCLLLNIHLQSGRQLCPLQVSSRQVHVWTDFFDLCSPSISETISKHIWYVAGSSALPTDPKWSLWSIWSMWNARCSRIPARMGANWGQVGEIGRDSRALYVGYVQAWRSSQGFANTYCCVDGHDAIKKDLVVSENDVCVSFQTFALFEC